LRLDDTVTRSGMDWAEGFDAFTPGEAGALAALDAFIANGLRDYADGRDRPDQRMTSRLSPHLRFGEISPRRVLHEIEHAAASDPQFRPGATKFRSEMLWREFCYGLLHQQPCLHTVNFRSEFNSFPWQEDETGFRAWTRGQTGYPLVDAGMRELWQTGWMHNRVRMVTASFLTKHLLIDWRRGEQWFWDCLLDADPANNPAGWQWVAGSGADAAPYFRIFNPAAQADRYDPKADYRRRFIPGYTLSSKGDAHRRIEPDLFDSAGKDSHHATYPQPIVDHAFARQRALDAYRQRGGADGDSAYDNAD
ncbi:MAG: cryptochrome/photolyase family protein, partial [Asticcacaulis sp.]